ncbi:MAG: hypothetical protein JWP85_2822 [Rhodoglobus sp.]|nr:hypothetical protein [Rhodoglobus sp.]
MSFAEMYFDESESDKHNLLCVSGYIFKKERCEILEGKWSEVLKREGLPYFHMVECAHQNKTFKGFDETRCIAIQTELMNLLKDHIEVGVSITYDLSHAHLCPSAKLHGIDIVSPYYLCCYFALMQIREWMKKENFSGDVSYWFESGHKNQTQANHIMNEIFSVPEMRSHYCYGSHSFIKKESAGALQCADILAWQWAKRVKDQMDGKDKMRADLKSLLEKPHFYMHFDLAAINEFRLVIQNSMLS